jgi:hypothetical protein
MGRLRSVLIAAMLGVAACGPAQTDPYSLLDRAWSAGWDRVQLQLGVTLEVQNQGGDVMPLPNNINVDPSAITAIVDTHTGQWRLTLAIPGNAAGLPALFGVGVQAVNAEILFDGTNLFAKSDLLPMLLQPGLGAPPLIHGDLSGWVRLGSTTDLGPFLDPANPGAMLPIAAALPGLGALPLPSPGSPATLRQFFEDFGVVAEFKGTEARNGRDAHHVEAGLDITKLARSDRLAALMGWGRDQVQGLTETAQQVAVSSDWWFDKETGRVVSIELNLRTVQAPATHFGATLLLSEPAMVDPFTAPATYTEVPLKDLLGIGATGGGGSSGAGGAVMATPAPMAP